MQRKLIQLVSAIGMSCLLLSACQESFTKNNAEQAATKSQITMQDIPKMSVQLWSVNEDLAKDFKGTMTEIASMGFTAVEFAGDFGPYEDDPKGLVQFLDSLNLKVSGAHVPMRKLTADKFDKTVDFYQAIGTPMILVPSDKRAEKADTINAFVTELNIVAKKMRARGIGFGFHNHDRELVPYKDSTFWDYIAENTQQDFILQLDVGWVQYAQKDPVMYVQRYPNRTVTTHYKAKYTDDVKNKKPLIGQDITDWKAVLKANIAVGGTQWLVVEQEEYPDGLTPLEAVRISKQGLDEIINELITQ